MYNVILRVVGKTVHSKLCKSCCPKTIWAVDDTKPLTGSHSCACVYNARRRLEYCTEVLSQRRFIKGFISEIQSPR